MSIEVKINKSRISYKKAMLFLNKRVALLKENDGKDLLWVLEHPITYTAGIRSKSDEILDKKIKITYTNRGGKITLHNPGQKIIYFVLNLKDAARMYLVDLNLQIELTMLYPENNRNIFKNTS